MKNRIIKTLFTVVAVIVTAFSFLPGRPAAALTVDQEYATGGDDYTAVYGTAGNPYVYQIFQPSATQTIQGVEFYAWRKGTTGSMGVSIYSVNQSSLKPIAEIWGSTINATAWLVEDTDGGFQSGAYWNYVSTTGVDVTAGTKYAIVLHYLWTGGDINTNCVRWGRNDGGSYTPGGFGTGSATPVWTYENFAVQYFRTYTGDAIYTLHATTGANEYRTLDGSQRLEANIDTLLNNTTNVTTWGFNLGVGSSNYTANYTDSGSRGTGSYYYDVPGLVDGTDYYYRAAVYESTSGWFYGASNHFTYTLAAPTVSTGSMRYNDATSANATLLIEDIGGGNADEIGFEWSETSGGPYTSNVTSAGNWSSIAFHTLNVPGLALGGHYFYRAMAHNAFGWAKGLEATYTHGFGNLTPHMVTGFSTHSSTLTQFTVDLNIDSIGSANVTTIGVQWGPSDGNYTSNVTQSGLNIGTPDGTVANWYSYSENITAAIGETVHYRSIGYNVFGWGYGVDRAYTHEMVPTTLTRPPVLVPGSAPVAVGEVIDTGFSGNVSQVGFTVNMTVMGTSQTVDILISYVPQSTGIFMINFPAYLVAGDVVSYRAFATSIHGVGDASNWVSFTVGEDFLEWLGPTVRTVARSNITKNSFDATGEVQNAGAHRVVTRGFQVSRDKINIDGFTDKPSPAGNWGLGLWTETIHGAFNPGETLYFRADAWDEIGNMGAGAWMEVKLLTGSGVDPGGPPGSSGDWLSDQVGSLLNAWNMNNTSGRFAFIALVCLAVLFFSGMLALFALFEKQKLVAQITMYIACGICVIVITGALFSGFLGWVAIAVTIILVSVAIYLFGRQRIAAGGGG